MSVDAAEITPDAGLEHASTLRRLTAGTARMASTTALRQVLTMGALAFTAAVVARFLGPRSYGQYAGGTAAFNLLGGLSDLGFSMILLRELGKTTPEDEGHLIGTTVIAQCLWGSVLSAALLVMAATAHGLRADVMLIMVPSIALSGLAASRTIFSVRYIARPLLILDISTTLAQCAVAVALAALHAPVLWLAVNLSGWYCLTNLLAIRLARRHVTITWASAREVLALLRRALPLGAASVLASLYFTIDLTLLGWLVRPEKVALYAVAVRILTLVVTVPGFVMAAGIPGLSRQAHDRDHLTAFAATLTSWIAMTALPLCLFIGVFAHPLINLLFGPSYLAAVPVMRVLMLAGVLSLGSNVTGIILMTKGIVGPQIFFNSISLVINVVGNILLVPHYGIMASAWLTAICEAIVLSYGLVVLRSHVSWRRIGRRAAPSVLSSLLAAGVGLALGHLTAVALPVSIITFAVTMTICRGWPEPLVDALRLRFTGPGEQQGD
jgi:O-antigen/teichoic acid export membrane protein